MKRKTPKLIAIKDPKLRKIRRNLRILIDQAVYAELDRLRQLIRLNREKIEKSTITLSQKEKDGELESYRSILHELSIHWIGYCRRGIHCLSKKDGLDLYDLDKVWVPQEKSWLCEKCYEYFFKPNQKRLDHLEGYVLAGHRDMIDYVEHYGFSLDELEQCSIDTQKEIFKHWTLQSTQKEMIKSLKTTPSV